MRHIRHILWILAIVALPVVLSGRKVADKAERESQDDKYVRLMSAKSVSIEDMGTRQFRKAIGPARFLHNDTWLICDTALWDVDAQVIYAIGHVSIEQDRTELVSDKLTYFVERNLAEFRGSLVQLRDKDNNTLRTTDLDYNTKDSVAVFTNGGAMRDKDGQIIESSKGTYDAKAKLFTFHWNVNMFTDSVFVKTEELTYHSDSSLAVFPRKVDMWKDDKMFCGDEGWYNRGDEMFFFRMNVHMMSDTQEGWCDTVYFHRGHNDVDMRGSVQLVDTSRAITSLAGRMYLKDSLVQLFREPVLMTEMEDDKNGVSGRDTVYFAGDSIRYWSVRRCYVDSLSMAEAQTRLKDFDEDPVANIRKKAAEEEAKRRQEAIDNDPNAPPELKTGYVSPEEKRRQAEEAAAKAVADSLAAVQQAVADSLAAVQRAVADSLASVRQAVADSLTEAGVDSLQIASTIEAMAQKDAIALRGGDVSALADSLAVSDSLAMSDSLGIADSLAAEPLDTSKVAFIQAHGNVKMLRRTMQAVCDSLRYSELDSLARLYKNPMVWNDVTHQYNADSIFVSLRNEALDKVYLISSAFIHVQETENLYDQIRSTEMTAFFDENSQLKRFDALGGVTALFYIKEKDVVTTVNRKETTILSADFNDGEISEITYFESPKSDAYPLPQFGVAERHLKGFNWQPDLRPKSPKDLSWRFARKSERKRYLAHRRPEYQMTEKYFKGYMDKIYREIERSDSLRRIAALRAEEQESAADSLDLADSLLPVIADSSAVAALSDSSLSVPADSIVSAAAVMSSVAVSDTSVVAVTDSLSVADSIAALDTLSPKERIRMEKLRVRAERERLAQERREQKQRELEAKWAELDRRDSLKQAAKLEKIRLRQEERERKQMLRIMRQKEKEDALREKYKQKFLKRMRFGEIKNDNLPQ